MKINNKTIAVITLIFIVIAMSVIYAAVSSSLNISSKANVGSNMEFDIKLQGIKCEVVKGTGTNTISGEITTNLHTTVTTSNTVLYAPGDEVECTFKAVNNGNIDVILDSVDVDGITSGTVTYTDNSALSTTDQNLIDNYITYTLDDNDSKDIIENNDIKGDSSDEDKVLSKDGGEKNYKINIKFSSEASSLPSKSILINDITSNLLYVQTGKTGSESDPVEPTTSLAVGDAVYFNPVSGEKCTDYIVSQSTGNSNTGCLKWYVIGTNGSNVDLLLDHNTTYEVEWYDGSTVLSYNDSSDSKVKLLENDLDYENESTVMMMSRKLAPHNPPCYNFNQYTTSDGPLTLLVELKSDTEGWTGVPTRSDSYVDGAHSYTINYTGYKARLITADEVWNITKSTNGKANWSSATATSSDSFYFEGSGKSGQGTSAYPWLFDYTRSCTEYGCNTSNSNTYGYWTASSIYGSDGRCVPLIDSFSSVIAYTWLSGGAWKVDSGGFLEYNEVRSNFDGGIRPVITIPSSSL